MERVERAATKLPETLREHTYEERLEKVGLTTLERIEQGDLIALYRIRGGLGRLDTEDLVVGDRSETRGNSKKLKNVCRKDIKKNNCPQRSLTTQNRQTRRLCVQNNS